MAVGYLPEPGSEYGPCASECSHTDCAATRRMRATLCSICDEPIGSRGFFYHHPVGGAKVMQHATCAEGDL